MNKKIILGVILVITFLMPNASIKASTRDRTGELVIFTYESLLAWGKNATQVNDSIFGEFGRRHNVTVRIVYFSDARSALLAAIELKGTSSAPDLVIGIDNILVHEALSQGLLVNFTPDNISKVDPRLIEILDPTLHVIPYDYGAVVPVVRTDVYSENSSISPLNWTFDDLAKVADKLITEDPSLSTPGLSFLLFEIALESKLLGRDWKDWWRNVKDKIRVVPSWGDAYDEFLSSTARPIVISYGTDSAYSYHFEGKVMQKPYPVWANGSPYVWLQVEGIGVVNGSVNENLAKEFVGWFLSDEVQSLIPLNNWMYPATNVTLPPEYDYALNISNVKFANDLLSREEIRSHLSEWLVQWKNVMSTDWTGTFVIVSLVAAVSVVIVLIILRKKHFI